MEEKQGFISDTVLKEFGLFSEDVTVVPIQQGLINNTWKVSGDKGIYIIQKVNSHVFKNPEDIAFNISAVSTYLKNNFPEYFFVSPVATISGEYFVKNADSDYYRAFPFVKDSHARAVVSDPGQAYEAARQFGLFTRLLSGFDVELLRTTIPSFHDLLLRYKQFTDAITCGNAKRIKEAGTLIEFLQSCSKIASGYKAILINPAFKRRVTHHDTKISNVLFDDNDKGLCVIDLDTMMPGYFISDVGDMMRTYLCPVSEEETDLSLINVREEYYEALVTGYFDEMKDELTATEKKHFFYAGTYMIYMQALRFLTDYLNNDVYYGARYAEHNLNRAKNQAQLLSSLLQKKDALENLVLGK